MDQLKRAVCDVISYNQEARKDISKKDACKKCSTAINEIIKLSEPWIGKVYSEMKRKGTERGTGVGCPECVDAFTFTQAYLRLLNLPEYATMLEIGRKYVPTEDITEVKKRQHSTIE